MHATPEEENIVPGASDPESEADPGLSERKVKVAEGQLALARETFESSRWSNPLVLAILAAALAAGGNAIVALINGRQEAKLESLKSQQSLTLEMRKAEQSLILEMIKAGGNPDRAADNLSFLLDAKLIDPERSIGIRNFLFTRAQGTFAPPPPPLYPAHIKPFPQFSRTMCTGDSIPKNIAVTVSLAGNIEGPYEHGPIAPGNGDHLTYVLAREFAEPHSVIESKPWGGGFTLSQAPHEDYEICVQLPEDATGIKDGHISVHDVRDKP